MMLSIIIPMYNAEKTINRCLDSIVGNEGFDECELIIVNDGSSDNSKEIVEEYQKCHNNIKLINCVNGGVATARNTGMAAVTSEWITFVDADDVLEEAAISVMRRSILVADNSDLIVFGSRIKEKESFSLDDEKVRHEIIKAAINGSEDTIFSRCHMPSPCSKLYRTENIKKFDIKFPMKVLIGEDMLFNVAYLDKCRRVQLINKGIYWYYKNNRSVTNSYVENILCSDEKYLVLLKELLQDTRSYYPAYEVNVLGGIWVCLMRYFAYKNDKKVTDKIEMLDTMLKREPYCEIWNSWDKTLVVGKKRQLIFGLLKKGCYLPALIVLRMNLCANQITVGLKRNTVEKICI